MNSTSHSARSAEREAVTGNLTAPSRSVARLSVRNRSTSRWIHIAAGTGALLCAMLAAGADRAPPAATADAYHDADGDRFFGPRELDLSKVEKRSREEYDRIDSNNDGRINPAELAAAAPMGLMARGFGHRFGGHGGRHHDRHMGPGPDGDGPRFFERSVGPGDGPDEGPGDGPGHGHAANSVPMPPGAPPPFMDADHEHAPPDPEQLLGAWFKRLDANKDGRLTDAEFKNLREAQRAEMQAQAFARLDRDGNGSLSRSEFPPMLARLQSLDANHDGKLTRDEFPRHRSPPEAPPAVPASDGDSD